MRRPAGISESDFAAALEAFEAFGLAALVFDPAVAFTAAALALPDVVLAFASCSTRAAAAAATAHPPRLRAIAGAPRPHCFETNGGKWEGEGRGNKQEKSAGKFDFIR